MVRQQDTDGRHASSRLRQPTQYTSPPCKSRPVSAHAALHHAVKYQSISDMSDDGSDSDSSVFPLRRCLVASSCSPTTSTRKLRRQFPTLSPKSGKHVPAAESAAMEATIKEQRRRLIKLEDELAIVQGKNKTLEAAAAEAASAHLQQEAVLHHFEGLVTSLRQTLETEQDKHRHELRRKNAELDELRCINENLRQEIRDGHAAMTELQEQAKQAAVHTRRLWQERLEMEYEIVRSAAKCNQESAMAQRAEELKALQGLRSVSQSVFKEEECDEYDDEDITNQQDTISMELYALWQRRRRRWPSSTPDSECPKSCWMDEWIDRQMQRHRDGLKWLDTIEHHLEEDAVEYGAAVHESADAATFELADERFLDEIEMLLRQDESMEDTYQMRRIRDNAEQLNMKRAEKTKSASQALSLLAKQSVCVGEIKISHSVSSITDDYSGPRLAFPLRLHNVLDMLEQFKKGVVLHSKYVMDVLSEAKKVFTALPTLQEIAVAEGEKLTVVGDIHGQLKDLFTIFTTNGLPSGKNKYLFNGDFVDRGAYGTEVMMTLLCFKLLYPDGVYLNRGNHESRNQNSWMGFEEEIWAKYDGTMDGDPCRASTVYDAFQGLFDSLPLCALVLKKIFVVHGGLFSCDNVTLAHIKAINRKREPPLHQTGFEDKIYEDMLWSDPRTIAVIRSHECVPEGYDVLHGGRLITLFSASRYCGTQMNKGAFLTLGSDLQPEIQQFYGNPLNESEWERPEDEQAKMQENLEGDALRMIAERICDHKADLFWYFTQHEHEHKGTVPRLVWAEALKSILGIDLPFLLYQTKLADSEPDNTINYSK
ncbi:hypothetical protein DYB32_001382 [Aphanomyces invadans]|uniref:Serine/threonine-protein phosphatase n=1 Tax=Aphanomyces invadans TaxID=157072 RepID=A0A418B6N0_9STRA|nr:hypothetical protein DYB32_001382 [Aphanomyces invadans]